MKKKYKLLIALSSLALAAGVGGTWAAWTSELWVANEFETAAYKTEITEVFERPNPGDWAPGMAWEKKVAIENQENVDAVAALHLNLEWVRTSNVLDLDGNPIPPVAGEQYHLMFPIDGEENGKREYAAQIGWSGDVAVLDEEPVRSIGLEAGIENQVSGLGDAAAAGKWVLVGAEEDDFGYSDLYFIYVGVIKGGQKDEAAQTPWITETVTLNKHLESTITGKITRNWYDQELGIATSSTAYTYSKYGYDSARYTMDFVGYTVQATESAIREVFAGVPKPIAERREELIQAVKGQLIPEYQEAGSV